MVEHALKNLLAQGAPATRDLAFELAVMARIEQRRFHRALLEQAALAAGVTLLLGLLVPRLDSVLRLDFTPVVSDMAIALALLAARFYAPRLLGQ